MAELDFELAATRWLEFPPGKEELGPVLDHKTPFANLVGFIGEEPRARSIRAVQEAAGAEPGTSDGHFESRFKPWLIRNTVSVRKKGGVSEPIAVGIEVNYKDHRTKRNPNRANRINPGKSISIFSLFPAAQFRDVITTEGDLEFGFRFRASMSDLGALGVPTENTAETVTASLDGLEVGAHAGAGASAKVELSLRASTPVVQAMGVGDTQAEWLFEHGSVPLYGKDIVTWTGLVVPSQMSAIEYEVRLYVLASTLFYRTRHYSDWIRVRCPLEDIAFTGDDD